ncbi:hypothetical protein H0H92_012147 [Tricholoma furcatifolium]|nr:hypothetical protein H0H92_012147 [Tricholoma furcatifolium]
MELVDGLYIKGPLTVPGTCEDCVYGKHVSRPYDAKVEIEAHPNQRVHIDLWGPASVVSLGALTAYHAEYKRQTGRKLLEVHVDAGREWINELWTAYLAQHGIIKGHHSLRPCAEQGCRARELHNYRRGSVHVG